MGIYKQRTQVRGRVYSMKSKPISKLNQLHPTTCPILKRIRAEHEEYRFYYDYEYITYILPGGVKALEHRLVAQAAYGEIPDGHHVHHIDRNRAHNAAANLLTCSPSEHSHIHRPKGEYISLVCPTCKKTFEETPARAKRRKHCSVACARSSRCPSRDRLAKLLDEVRNFCELGRMFGVSDNAVRKWAKRYGLDISHVDGRLKRTA